MTLFLQQPPRYAVSSRWRLTLAKLLPTLLLALILTLRPMYVALDDLNYVNYFSGEYWRVIDTGNYWLALIEEPIWLAYTSVLGAILDPEIAVRVTIFVSVCLFFFSLNRLAPQAYLFIFLAFLICDQLAVQLYFNQIRQGLALSLFLLVLALTNSPAARFGGTLVASLVHTAFLAVAPVVLIARLVKHPMYRLAIGSLVAIGLLILAQTVAPNIEWGRREAIYEFGRKFNFNYYIFILVEFAPIFILTGVFRHGGWKDDLYYVTLVYFILAFGVTLINEVGGRLMYFSTAFVVVLIGINFRFKQGKIAAIYWLVLSLFYVLYEGTKLADYDSWSGRWSLILGL